MAQFQYTAVNNTGKKLSGLIAANSEEEARKQLNVFGISVLSMEKVAESQEQTPVESELSRFEFEAYDKTGQKVVGTIPALSRQKAFSRLIEEYQFQVAYVVPVGASDAEKEKAKTEDLSVLKAEYDAVKQGSSQAKSVLEGPIENDPRFAQRREMLVKRVEIILDKIKNLLNDYAEEIKPENKKMIQETINKLLRIKSSTNLDYVEHISESLLKKVQDQELFLHKEKMEQTRQKLKMETQQLMSELHSKSTQEKGLDLENLQEKLGHSENRWLKYLSEFLTHFVDSPEVKMLKSKLRMVNKQVWAFRKIWLMANRSVKAEAYSSLKAVLAERDRLKKELKALQTKEKAESIEIPSSDTIIKEKSTEPFITEEVTHFIGWLLFFYLIAYFFSHYVLAKNFVSGNPLPGDFNLLYSNLLRGLLISLFLWYTLFSLRLNYLKEKAWANLLIIPLGMVVNAGLVLNL